MAESFGHSQSGERRKELYRANRSIFEKRAYTVVQKSCCQPLKGFSVNEMHKNEALIKRFEFCQRLSILWFSKIGLKLHHWYPCPKYFIQAWFFGYEIRRFFWFLDGIHVVTLTPVPIWRTMYDKQNTPIRGLLLTVLDLLLKMDLNGYRNLYQCGGNQYLNYTGLICLY